MMTRRALRAVGALLAVAAAAAAYLVGRWPEREARLVAERQLRAVRLKLERAASGNRLYELQAELVAIAADLEAGEFPTAQVKGTAFFDSVRSEIGRADQVEARSPLQRILQGRDAFTIAVARRDRDAAAMMVRGMLAELREALQQRPLSRGAMPDAR